MFREGGGSTEEERGDDGCVVAVVVAVVVVVVLEEAKRAKHQAAVDQWQATLRGAVSAAFAPVPERRDLSGESSLRSRTQSEAPAPP